MDKAIHKSNQPVAYILCRLRRKLLLKLNQIKISKLSTKYEYIDYRSLFLEQQLRFKRK